MCIVSCCKRREGAKDGNKHELEFCWQQNWSRVLAMFKHFTNTKYTDELHVGLHRSERVLIFTNSNQFLPQDNEDKGLAGLTRGKLPTIPNAQNIYGKYQIDYKIEVNNTPMCLRR